MISFKSKTFDKVLSVILAVIMCVGMLPATVFASTDTYTDKFTFTVKNGEGAAIDDAAISGSILVEGEEPAEFLKETDANGKAAIDLSGYAEAIAQSKVKIAYTVEKEGYTAVVCSGENAVAVTNVTGNIAVNMTEISNTQEESKVSVTLVQTGAGAGTVKIGETVLGAGANEFDAGTSYTVTVTANEGSYIKSVTIGGAEQTVTADNELVVSDVSITEDTTVSVEFGEFISVSASVSPEGGGTVKFGKPGGKIDQDSLQLKQGDSYYYKVVAEKGYVLTELKIGAFDVLENESGVTEKDDKVEFVSADNSDVTATFAEAYTVTVSYDENGTVTLINGEQKTTGGSISVKKEGNTGFTLVATPSETYRVASVKLNDNPVENFEVKNSEPYTYEVKEAITGNYEFKIAFKLNKYTVTAQSKNGTFTLKGEEDSGVSELTVEHGSYVTIKDLQAAVGYTFNGITLGGEAVTVNEEGILEWMNKDGKPESKITGDTTFTAVFSEISPSNMTDIIGIYTDNGKTTLAENFKEGDKYFYNNPLVLKSKNTKYIAINSTPTPNNPKNSYEINASEIIDKASVYDRYWVLFGGYKEQKRKDKDATPVYIVIDKEAPTVEFTTGEDKKATYYIPSTDENAVHYYNGPVTFFYEVKEVAGKAGDWDRSGIQSVSYSVYYLDAEGEKNVIEENKDAEGTYKYGTGNHSYLATRHFTVDKCYDNMKVDITVTDAAGNTYTETSQTFCIDKNTPEVTVSVSGDKSDYAADGCYYNAARTATITIANNKKSFFNEQSLRDAIKIYKIVDKKEEEISSTILPESFSLQAVSGKEDTDTYAVSFTFAADGEYKWSVGEYTNKAGVCVSAKEDEANKKFVIDKTSPTGSISAVDRNWDKIVETLTFGLWTNKKVDIEAIGSDDCSGIQEDVYYYKVDKPNEIINDFVKLTELYEKKAFSKGKISVEKDSTFLVYARLVDNAGNVTFVSTDGIILDGTNGTIVPKKGTNIITSEIVNDKFYNDDVIFEFTVNENTDDGTFSGLKKVWYVIQKNCVVNSDTGIVSGDKDTKFTEEIYVKPVNKAELKDSVEGVIVVDSEKYNDDSVNVTIYAEDNAGNTWSWGECSTFAINTCTPVVTVSFNDDKFQPNGDSIYFKTTDKKRVATLTISGDRDSAFNAAANTVVLNGEKKPEVGLWINAVNAAGETVELELDKDIIFSKFSKNEKGNMVATVEFVADAEYEWGFAYKNQAGNQAEAVKTAEGTKAPFRFVSDSAVPTGKIKIYNSIGEENGAWEKLLKVITFGIYDTNNFRVVAESADITSPTEIYYYITSDKSAKNTDTLDKLYEEGKFTEYTGEINVAEERSLVVFTRVEDAAGNYIYICSDGRIIDDNAPEIELTVKPGNRYTYAEGKASAFKGDTVLTGGVVEGYFNGDITLDLAVKDPAAPDESYSGISTVSYTVECDGKATYSETLYDYSAQEKSANRVWENIDGEFKKENIVIDAAANNSSNVVVYFTVTDNAGNTYSTSAEFDIDVTAPVIDVKYDEAKNKGADDGYFTARTATVTVTERDAHFDADAVDINIIARNSKVEDIPFDYDIEWKTNINEKNPDETSHTAVIVFDTDANYIFDIAYTDKANNAAVSYSDRFCVDTVAPGTIIKADSVDEAGNKGHREWTTLAKELTFGFSTNKSITVTGEFADATSHVKTFEYYKVKANDEKGVEGTVALTAAELDKVTAWTPFEGLEIAEDEQCVVYVKTTDLAGNYAFYSTNGMIVDHTLPNAEKIAPEITINPQQPINGIYNGDVKVDIKVVDPITGSTYSGLKEINYKVFDLAVSDKEPTQSGNLFTFESPDPKQSDLKQSWEGSITVDSKLNNSNNIKIVIYAVDNAQNASEQFETVLVDTTAPVINVSYDNNSVDSGEFFKADRTATIKITERNFKAEDVVVTITNAHGKVPAVSAWKDVAGKGNNDNATHTATVKFTEDGDYTFKVAYTDLAGNKCEKVIYADGTASAEKFTIDKTIPVVSVSYDNNSAKNERFFSANRTATIVVKEHDFDVSRVQFTQKSSYKGAAIANPSVTWKNDGDIHTATIKYVTDGDYEFDVTLKDKAGNASAQASYGSSVAGKNFTVDTAINEPAISGVTSGQAYKDDVIPTVSFDDVNFDSYEIKLTKTERSSANVDVTSTFITSIKTDANGGSGSFDSFEKLTENDGIYTLSAKMIDKAGNESSKSVTFTINRFGSVYQYDEYLCDLIKDGGKYIKADSETGIAINNDIVITEFNADSLVDNSLKILITRDGEAIDVDYTRNVTPSSGWYEYKYIISKSNFAEDGVYKISISSNDATGNSSTSVPENSVNADGKKVVDIMNFTVDTTLPEIRNITNLENAIASKDAIVDGKLNVKYAIVDVGGLAKVEVYLNGQVVDTITEFENANNFTGTFDIGESNDIQSVRIVVTDLAGNVTDTDSEEFDPGEVYAFNKTVTVSTNIFVRWYRNTALFFGSIGGVVVVIAAIWFLVAKKKKKNEEEK